MEDRLPSIPRPEIGKHSAHEMQRRGEIGRGDNFIYMSPIVNRSDDLAEITFMFSPSVSDKAIGVHLSFHKNRKEVECFVDAMPDEEKFANFNDLRAYLQQHDVYSGMMSIIENSFCRSVLNQIQEIRPETTQVTTHTQYRGCPAAEQQGAANKWITLKKCLEKMEKAGLLTNRPEFNAALKKTIERIGVLATARDTDLTNIANDMQRIFNEEIVALPLTQEARKISANSIR